MYRENQNTQFTFSKFFCFENRAVYEIMSKNVVQRNRPQITIWCHVACWISKTTRAQEQAQARAPTTTYIHAQNHPRRRARTHTDQEIIIFIAFPLQQLFRESAWMLCYMHCLSCLAFHKTHITTLQRQNVKCLRVKPDWWYIKWSVVIVNTIIFSNYLLKWECCIVISLV